MKHLIFLLALTLFTLGLSAQVQVQDPDAEPWLDKASQLFAAEQAMKIDFSYSREDLQTKEKVEGEGTLYMKKEKYRVEMDAYIIYFDGEKQYSQNTDAEEVYISKPDPDNMDNLFSDPVRLLKNYKTNFKYRIIGETRFNNRQVMEIQLYPIDISGPYALIKLYMNYNNDEPAGIFIRHKDGITYTMIPGEISRNLDKTDQFFRFNPEEYKGFDVISLID